MVRGQLHLDSTFGSQGFVTIFLTGLSPFAFAGSFCSLILGKTKQTHLLEIKGLINGAYLEVVWVEVCNDFSRIDVNVS